jgi:hypothetical protein
MRGRMAEGSRKLEVRTSEQQRSEQSLRDPEINEKKYPVERAKGSEEVHGNMIVGP